MARRKAIRLACPVCKNCKRYSQYELEEHIGDYHNLGNIKVEFISLLYRIHEMIRDRRELLQTHSNNATVMVLTHEIKLLEKVLEAVS